MTTLNYADRFYIGGAQPSAVYMGATKVWRPFVPTSISGCVIWLDASKLSLANGAAVSSWTNLGSGPQPTVFSTAPTFRTNAVNTIMPVVRFSGGQIRFAGTGIDKDYTVLFVARRWGLKAGRVVSVRYVDGTTPNILWGFWSNRMECAHVQGWLTPDTVVPSTTEWKLYCGDATSAAGARLFSNGTLLRSGSTTPAMGVAGGLVLGGHNDEKTEEADCEIAEVLMYSRRLSDAERQAVEKYLREKWMGLPLWSPSDLGSNLVAWFDSSDSATVQLAGQGVNNWVNKKSGGAMTVTQSVNDTYRPTINNGDGVTFALAQGMNAANGPASFDVVMAGKPNPPGADPINWRTMLRSVGGHEIIVEDKTTRLGAYYTGFFSALVATVSPTNMTSDTAPAPYVAWASNSYAGYPPYLSFDGNPGTYSHSAQPTTTEGYSIRISLGATPKFVTQYVYQARPEANPPQQWKNWMLYGSNDDWGSWTLLDTVTNAPLFSAGERRTYGLDVQGSFRSFQWNVSEGQNYTPPYAAAAALELQESLTWGNVDGIAYARVAPSTAVQMSRDGGVLCPTGIALPATSAAPTMFGCYMGPPPTQGFGVVKEIIFLTHNLESERQKIEGYLAHKWGLQGLLPAGHPYKAAPP